MNILFITPRLPYPPLKGDQVVSFNKLRLLSRNHKITLLSFYEREEELKEVENLSIYCTAIHLVKLAKWRSMLNIIHKAPFSSLPMQILYYQSASFQKILLEVLRKNHFDLVHAYLFRVAPYLSSVPIPKILDLIDSMQLNLERRISFEDAPLRWIYQEELRRVIPYESDIGKSFDHLIVVSDIDRTFICGDNVTVIPNGVDTDRFKSKERSAKEPVITFFGNMDYAPNIHAACWFTENCFSRIQNSIPNATLVIAGGNPTKEVRALECKPGVKVTGFVKSMPDVINQADIAIAPMRSGSGIQNKILEAMACGLPTVTTSLGLGGIRAKPNEEIVIADTPEDFARAVIDLFVDQDKARAIGSRARDFVIQNHSWMSSANRIEEIYSKVLSSKAR